MIRGSRLLAVSALALSGALHLSGVSLFWDEAAVEMEGGAPATVARLGNSFQDVAQGTQAAETPEEVQDAEAPESQAEQVTPDELARAAPEETMTQAEPEASPTRTEPERTAPAETPTVTAEAKPTKTMTQPRPDTAPPTQAREAAPVARRELRAETAIPAPTQALRPDPTTSVLVPVIASETPKFRSEPVEALPPAPEETEAREIEAHEPETREIEPEEPTVIAALPQEEDEVAPLISTRPSLRPKSVEEAARQAAPPEPRAQPQRQRAQGRNQPEQVRGSTDGQRTATQTETSDRQTQTSRQAGNAAASNYPGQVMRTISRQRRPSVNSRGTATVSFQIASSGALAGLSLARSSGSQALDAAALDLVRRAAPFPAPPPGARRSFSIGIEGR